MKNLLALIQAFILSSGAFAQGLVNFYNTPTTLVSFGPRDAASPITGPPGRYYFGLLTSGSFAGPYTFTGLYGTNQATPGMFSGGASVTVPGWAPGATLFYEILGWSADMGHDFDPSWLIGNDFLYGAYIGASFVGIGAAGGSTSTGTLPPLDLFGGTSGLQSGFVLFPALVPEPSAISLFGLGAGLLIWGSRRRRKRHGGHVYVNAA